MSDINYNDYYDPARIERSASLEVARRASTLHSLVQDDEVWAALPESAKKLIRERLSAEDREFHGRRVEARLSQNAT